MQLCIFIIFLLLFQGWSKSSRQSTLPQENSGRILPTGSPKRLSGGDASLRQIWRHLSDHKIRLHPHVRHRNCNVHLYEPNFEWYDFRDCTPRVYRWYNWGESQGAGFVRFCGWRQHYQVWKRLNEMGENCFVMRFFCCFKQICKYSFA